MKKVRAAVLFMLVFTSVVEAAISRNVNGYKSDRTCINDGGAAVQKNKNKAERQTYAKAKSIKVEKIEMPEGAECGGIPVDFTWRIESLCGYEIGAVAKVSWRPNLDKDGNIVVTEKLKKPFRKCTRVELKYSKVNHALYSIRVFAPAQKKVTDDEAWAEVETMADALATKFGDKIVGWNRSDASKWCYANMKPISHQDLEVRAYKDNIEKRGKLKGSADARPEQGWAFSVTLTDRAMRVYEAGAPKANKAVADDVDAL